MENMKEIKSRINSIKDTQKLTNAMYLISSAKMRKAKSELDKTRPYFNEIQSEIKRVFRTVADVESKYFYPVDGSEITEGTYGCLVITADKGLAGAYNINVMKEAEKLWSEHTDIKFFVVGEYGRQHFLQHNIPIERSFLYTAQNPTMQRAREISSILLELFEKGDLKKLFIIYTDWKNGLSEEAVSTQILPFQRSFFCGKTSVENPVTAKFDFFPSVERVLDNMMQGYVSGFIYSTLVDSFCSEQNARMIAMNAANQNAARIIAELSTQYNRVRQAAITQEITEVSAGAKAQKRKRMKEAESV